MVYQYCSNQSSPANAQRWENFESYGQMEPSGGDCGKFFFVVHGRIFEEIVSRSGGGAFATSEHLCKLFSEEHFISLIKLLVERVSLADAWRTN